MAITVTGINHRHASLALREGLAIPSRELVPTLLRLQRETPAMEAALLATCNRTEIYGVLPAPGDVFVDWLLSYHGGSDRSLRDSIYTYSGEHAVSHLLRVSSGLDSLILGESQILGQTKHAYRAARHAGTAGRLLSRLFEKGFATAKRVRRSTPIGRLQVSVASAAIHLAQQLFADLPQKTVLLLGPSRTTTLVSKHLRAHGISRFMLAAPEPTTATSWYPGTMWIRLDDCARYLREADIIVTAWGRGGQLLTAADAQQALHERRQRPMLFLDLGMPRDLDPRIATLSGAYLYNVDDIGRLVAKNMDQRRLALTEAEAIIAEETDQYVRWLYGLQAHHLIAELHDHMQVMSAALEKQAMRQLQAGADPAEVMHRFSHALRNRLLHGPTMALRLAAQNNDMTTLDLLGQALELGQRGQRESGHDE
jgi:glutamyl-tRNA reductase